MPIAEPSESLSRLTDLLGGFRIVDLSHSLEENMPIWPTLSKYYHTLWLSTSFGDNATAYQVIFNEHTGTHVDATGHFMPTTHPEHRWIDQIPPDKWMGRAAVVDCRDIPLNGTVPAIKIQDWERDNEPVHGGDIVVFNFGWYTRWATRPNDQASLRDWPGLAPDCVELLLKRGVKAIGVDTPSPDNYGVPLEVVHHQLLSNGVLVIENLTNLDQVAPLCYLIALPLPIKEGTGSPVRAVALVPR